eukprot:106257-Hanusia_phi.AAC.2
MRRRGGNMREDEGGGREEIGSRDLVNTQNEGAGAGGRGNLAVRDAQSPSSSEVVQHRALDQLLGAHEL